MGVRAQRGGMPARWSFGKDGAGALGASGVLCVGYVARDRLNMGQAPYPYPWEAGRAGVHAANSCRICPAYPLESSTQAGALRGLFIKHV